MDEGDSVTRLVAQDTGDEDKEDRLMTSDSFATFSRMLDVKLRNAIFACPCCKESFRLLGQDQPLGAQFPQMTIELFGGNGVFIPATHDCQSPEAGGCNRFLVRFVYANGKIKTKVFTLRSFVEVNLKAAIQFRLEEAKIGEVVARLIASKSGQVTVPLEDGRFATFKVDSYGAVTVEIVSADVIVGMLNSMREELAAAGTATFASPQLEVKAGIGNPQQGEVSDPPIGGVNTSAVMLRLLCLKVGAKSPHDLMRLFNLLVDKTMLEGESLEAAMERWGVIPKES